MTTKQDIQNWYKTFEYTNKIIERNKDNPIGLIYIRNELESFYYSVEDCIPHADSWDIKQVLFDIQSRANNAIDACDMLVTAEEWQC